MSSPRKEDGYQIFIGKLAWKAREEDLREKFEQFGDIKNVNLKRGFAFIVTIYLWKPAPEIC